ncbi:hypothetical protein D1007_57579 [Hordeum vulgare]|nr:hypothetical protein D1007_57579 [Hordeum vulgare]
MISLTTPLDPFLSPVQMVITHFSLLASHGEFALCFDLVARKPVDKRCIATRVTTGDASLQQHTGDASLQQHTGVAAPHCCTQRCRRRFNAATHRRDVAASLHPMPPVMLHCGIDANTTVLHRNTCRLPAMFHCNDRSAWRC